MADAYLALVGSVANVVGNDSPELMDRLAPYEKARAATFVRTRDRDRYLAAHWLVRRVAGMVAGLDPRDIELFQHCRRCGATHGPPSIVGIPDLHVSLSHTPVAVAAAAGAGPVGVDVEVLGKVGHRELHKAGVLAPREIAMIEALSRTDRDRCALSLWVRKEALIKLGRHSLSSLAECDLVGRPPTDLLFRDWVHADSGSIGVVASASEARVRFL